LMAIWLMPSSSPEVGPFGTSPRPLLRRDLRAFPFGPSRGRSSSLPCLGTKPEQGPEMQKVTFWVTFAVRTGPFFFIFLFIGLYISLLLVNHLSQSNRKPD
jgi:hypothetical protein